MIRWLLCLPNCGLTRMFSVELIYRRIPFDGLAMKGVMHLIQIGQLEQMPVVILIVQLFVQLSVIQLCKVLIGGFG